MKTDILLEAEAKLQQEAKTLLQNKSLWEPFLTKGKIIPCGSFDLGLLVYGDLDVYFEPHDPREVTATFAAAMEQAGKMDEIQTIRFERDLYKREPKALQGLYLQFKFDNGIRVWQIDIWSVDKAQQDAFLKEHEARKEKLKPQTRELILKLKRELMADKGKAPSFCSFHVYKAVLEEGLTELEDIKTYLVKQGIKLF